MNKIINNFFRQIYARIALKYPGFTYRACGSLSFTKMVQHILMMQHIHDAAYSDSQKLAKTTISDKILKDRT